MEYQISDTNRNSVGFTPAQPESIEQRIEKEKLGSALDIQVGGDHYKQFEIQPIEFCEKNKLTACQSNIIKYVCRFKFKDGIKDLEKAQHYLALLKEFEYGEQNEIKK